MQCRNSTYSVHKINWKTSEQPVSYPDALAFMDAQVQAMHEGQAGSLIWLLEHPPVYTAGTSAKGGDLLEARFPVYESGRGGQYTYHGPGQRVAYVMVDLRQLMGDQLDIRRYVWRLEQWIIDTLAAFGVKGERRTGRIGIWVDRGNGREDKIAALGVRVRHGIAFHGISINNTVDLSHFNGIVPCGIQGHGVTSLQDLGVAVTMEQLDAKLKETMFIGV